MTQSAEAFRLSQQQRRIWALGQAAGRPLRAACAVEVTGDLDRELLQHCLRQLVAEHEILRTAFIRQPGFKTPFQVIVERAEVDWQVLAAGDPETAEQSQAKLIRQELDRAAVLDDGIVLRARLLATEERAFLVLSLPALCADGDSLRQLVAELASHYAGSASAGNEEHEPSLQYVDYCDWQEEFATSEEDLATRGRAHWRRQDIAASRPQPLPFVPPPSAEDVPFLAPARRRIPLPAIEATRLRTVAEGIEVAPADILRAAWWCLAGRCTGATELVLAETFDGRDDPELARGIGAFARSIPLRLQAAGSCRFRDLIERLQRTRREAATWQHSFIWPAEDKLAQRPTIAFRAESWPAAETAAGVRFSVWQSIVAEPCDLTLSLLMRGDEPLLALDYDACRVPESEVGRLAGHFESLLAGALEDPTRQVSELPLLNGAERRRIVTELGRGPETAAAELVHRRIAAWARRRPQAPALVAEAEQRTYAELDRQANRLAHLLRRRGVGPEVPVALVLERSPSLLIAALAVLKAGGFYAAFDAHQPLGRITMMLEDLGHPLVVTGSRSATRLADLPLSVLCLDEEESELASQSPDEPTGGAGPENLAYVVFTSGTSGRPKGVAVAHRHLAAYLAAIEQRLDLAPGLSFASVSTFSADLGHTAVFGALASGGCLHLVSRQRAIEAQGLADYLERHTIDGLKIVPSHLQALQEAAGRRLLPRRRLVVGGEACRRTWIEGLGELPEGLALFNHYGPSEATVGALTYRLRGPVDRRCTTLPIGRPLAGQRVYLLDGAGQPVPLWAPGEIFLGGAGVARGYFRQPALTAAVFAPDALSGESGARLYRTGDSARFLPTGEVEFLGRRDQQVKYHGFRIELEELRTVLNTHPQVRDSVVRLVRDGDGRDALVAYYVARQALTFDALRGWLARTVLEEVLPALFVHLRQLPLTANGKVDLRALPDLEQARRRLQRPFVAPADSVEAKVAQVWAEVLGLQRVSVEDSFFELGGHSLLATRIISRLRETCGVEVAVRTIFDTPTVRAVAAAVREGQGTASAVSAPALARRRSIEDQLDDLEGLA